MRHSPFNLENFPMNVLASYGDCVFSGNNQRFQRHAVYCLAVTAIALSGKNHERTTGLPKM